VDDLPVLSLPCFYVRRGHREQGVMSVLIWAALIAARQAEAPAVEGYPVDTGIEGATRNVFTGTAAAFMATGFSVVARRWPSRPVVRHDLRGV
jgi:hypothetical protein